MRSKLLQNMNNDFLDYSKRISRSLCYVKMPEHERPSLPLTELMIEKINENREKNLDLLQIQEAANISLGASVTPCSVIVALIYIERMKTLNPDYFFDTSPSDLFVIALLLAGKYLYDVGEIHESFNDSWAAYSYKPLEDINKEEMFFLDAIDWNLFVDDETFYAALKNVESVISLKEGSKRCFFTYGEINCLIIPHMASILALVCSIISLCIVSYSLTIFTVTYIMFPTSQFKMTPSENVNVHSSTTNLSLSETLGVAMNIKNAIDINYTDTDFCEPLSGSTDVGYENILTSELYWFTWTTQNHLEHCKRDLVVPINNSFKNTIHNLSNYMELPPGTEEKISKSNMIVSLLFEDYYLWRDTLNVDSVMS